MTRWIAAAFVIVACGTSPASNDAGSDASADAGMCCATGVPAAGNCGPVAPGGWHPFVGGCKQKEAFDGRQVKPGTDDHGCAIWVDDGPCTYDGGPTCSAPVDVTGFSPTPMAPPHAKTQSACSAQQISDFAACNAGDAFACDAPDGSPCIACLGSKSSDAAWGALVDGSFWNSGGCVDLVLGQVGIEPSSCGAAWVALDECVAYACGQCPLIAEGRQECDVAAAKAACGSYALQTTASGGPCASLVDAGAPDVSMCFPDASIADLVARQKDFVTRIATFFCGP